MCRTFLDQHKKKVLTVYCILGLIQVFYGIPIIEFWFILKKTAEWNKIFTSWPNWKPIRNNNSFGRLFFFFLLWRQCMHVCRSYYRCTKAIISRRSIWQLRFESSNLLHASCTRDTCIIFNIVLLCLKLTFLLNV